MNTYGDTLQPALVEAASKVARLILNGAQGQLSPLDWRKRVRVERTRDIAKMPLAGFEDREDHRTPFASASKSIAPARVGSARAALLKVQRQEEPCRPSRRWR